MKILKVSDSQAIITAIKILNDGGVVVYPTDTLYGFGVDATNDSAIEKINSIKNRRGPISVLAPDIETAKDWLDIDINQMDFVSFYLGGSKTLIVPVKQNIVSNQITGENNSLGIRIPNNVFCVELAKAFNRPITSTSVNRSGLDAINDPILIASEFDNEIDLLIESGTLPQSRGSTIYQFKDNKIKILRK